MSDPLLPYDYSPPGSSVHGDSPGKNTGVAWSGLPCSPPGNLPNLGLNPGLPHCRQILYHLSHYLVVKNPPAM